MEVLILNCRALRANAAGDLRAEKEEKEIGRSAQGPAAGGPNSRPAGKAAVTGSILAYFLKIFFNMFHFFILNLKIKLCVMERVYGYYFI